MTHPDPHAGDVPMAIVRTTVEAEPDARRLARALIEGHLAACVHILPIHSVYRWEQKVVEAQEYLLEVRTTQERSKEVRKHIDLHHPYKLPLIESFGEVRVNDAYALWAKDETAK